MSGGLDTPALREGLQRVCAHLETVSDRLNELDAAIGDGDLGVTMVRGSRAIIAELPNLSDDLGQAFLQCAQAFTKTSGSTFGTLLATGLMSAARATKGRTEVPWQEVPALLAGALDAMKSRGKAELGDKTALDAMDALRRGCETASEPSAMLTAASQALATTMDELRDKPAQRGRARILGERSVGRDDPGMVVFQEILLSLRPTAA